MLRYIERHLLRNEAGNETAWRIQTIWDKLILVQLPLWLLNILIETHLEIDKKTCLIMWKFWIITIAINLCLTAMSCIEFSRLDFSQKGCFLKRTNYCTNSYILN
jgi:hypothetical protein